VQLTQQTIGAVVVLKPDGPITAGGCDTLCTNISSVAKQAMGRVVLDLEAVSYVDSRGIEALLDCGDVLAKVGLALKLCSVNSTVCDALALTGADAGFEFHLDAGTAARSFL
jgi:anti-anti-sigma factor